MSAKTCFCLFKVCLLIPFPQQQKLETLLWCNGAGFVLFFWKLLTGQGPFFFYTTAWVLQQLQRKHSINFALSLKIQVHICHLWEKREPPATRWWRMKAHKVLTKPPVGARPCNFTSQWATQTWLYSPVVNHSHGKEAPWILTPLSYTK